MDLERYEMLGNLSQQGGMSDIILGRDKQTDEQVVIKFMKRTAKGPDRSLRFEQEAAIALAVQHPHLLRAIGGGKAEHNGEIVPFLVSPYIAGGSLDTLLRETEPWKHWTLPQLVDVIVQAAEGLYYLHTRTPPIAHQDVKPTNFLVCEEQGQGPDRMVHIWLTDFGVSRWQQIYQTQTIIGTLAYMAPEQIQGSIITQSDQYSLALMTRYLFTGYPPDKRDIRARLSELNSALPREIDDIVLKALSSNPELRFPNVREFANNLRTAVMRQVGFHSEPTDPFAQPVQISPSVPLPQTSSPTTQLQLEIFSPTIQPKTTHFQDIPVNPISLHPTVNKPLPLVQTVESKEKYNPIEALPVSPLRTLQSKEAPALPSMLSWSPDGMLLSCTFYAQKSPWLLSMDGKIEVAQTLMPSHVACWSPDGQFLAMSIQEKSHKSSIYLWDREKPAEQPIALCTHNTPAIDGLDWSNQGQLAIWVEARILLYALPSQVTLSRFPSTLPKLVSEQRLFNGGPGTLRWSPDGMWLAAGANDGTLLCWHGGKQRPSLQIPACGARIYSLAWSSDSTWLAIAFQDKRVELWNMRDLRRERSWEKLPSTPQTLSFSPQEQVLTIATKRNLLFTHFSEAIPFAQYPGQTLIAWSPGGRQLATLDAENDMMILILQR